MNSFVEECMECKSPASPCKKDQFLGEEHPQF